MPIDAHQHFWQYDPAEYPWISDALAPLKQDFLPGDLAPHLSAAGLTHSVAVQARQSLVETEWLLQLAHQTESICAVVGWVDLQSPDVGSQLQRFAAEPKFAGVRHVAQDEPDDRFLVRPQFLQGIAQLAEFGLTYDILIYPRQLPAAIELVSRFPDQPFVLDHLAKPQVRDRQWQPWADQMRQLAALPNVMCKVSGMVTEADWHAWTPDDFAPYLDLVFDAFGTERLMFGSDWPVCRVAADYAQVVSLVRDAVRQRDPSAEPLVFGENCERFYLRVES